MLSHIEIKKRDGLARTGIFDTGQAEITFPAAVDILDYYPDLRDATQDNIPLSAPSSFVQEYWHEAPASPGRIHPLHTGGISSGDCVMVPGWHTALSNPRNYVKWLAAMKAAVPADTLWYAPATAVPSNVHILAYTGFDLFDFIACDLATARGKFLLPSGEFERGWMEAGTCRCEGCQSGDLRLHNRLALVMEVSLVRRFIAISRLREFVESRCRMQSSHVAILRHLDSMYGMMEQVVPVARDVPLGATTAETQNRVEIRRFARRVIERYIPPHAEVAVLLPCSARKPYSFSQSHRKYISAVQGRAHELIVTSPVGLVPRELELLYPAAHYDVPVTGYWDREEKAFISGVIAEYLAKHHYNRVIAHLEGGAMEVARMGAEIAGIDLECSTGDHGPTDGAALKALDNALSGCPRVRTDIVQGTCSWQFGQVPDIRGLRVRGRYPDLHYHRNREPVFSIDTGTGLVRPTFEGWRLLGECYRVEIADFVPKGDILVPGVTRADPAIREGDEVLVTGPSVIATGRAAMGAAEMRSSKRGVAVRVRKIKRQPDQ